ncbi:hypothetical protein BJ944DRAFT_232143 [Cunninghamella echinulata]|nr:hypothetical protein BJ944DRAFT_232143 [Cunninghamella echinulata]
MVQTSFKAVYLFKQKYIALAVIQCSRASMVNLGNDTIWIWGGQAQSTQSYSSNVLYLYDYRTSQWLNQISSNWAMRIQHTATLASNNVIYIFGGSYKINDSSFAYANFNQVIGFNTQTLSWSNITAGESLPKSRVSHTTTQIPGKNLLLIYGGVNASKEPDLLADSLCFTYDYVEISTLYGHYGIRICTHIYIYKLPAFSLGVLNITNLYNPSWVVEPLPIYSTSSNGTANGIATYNVNDFELEDPRHVLDRKDQFEFSAIESEKEEKKGLNEVKRCKPSETSSIKPNEAIVTKPTEYIGSFNNNNTSFTTITASTIAHTYSPTNN